MRYNTLRRFYYSCQIQNVTPGSQFNPRGLPTYGPPGTVPCTLEDTSSNRPLVIFAPTVHIPKETRITNFRDRSGALMYVLNTETQASIVWRVSGVELYTNLLGTVEYTGYRLLPV